MVAFVLGVIWALEEAESVSELVGGCCVTVDFDISYVIFVFFWGGYFGETLEFWLRR